MVNLFVIVKSVQYALNAEMLTFTWKPKMLKLANSVMNDFAN